MNITEQHILDALRHVEEPDLKKDLVTLNMIRDVRLTPGRVAFTVVLTTPACPLKDLIKNACVNAVQLLVDKSLEVDVHFTANVTQSNVQNPLPGVRNLIAVGSGKGGVGKSTVAANLAMALARAGASVGILDADIYGPSLPTMFNLVDERPFLHPEGGKDWMRPFEQFGVKVMSIGFLVQSNQPVVWRGPMVSKALNQLLTDTWWGELDYLVVDLPPGTGDVHITICQQFPLTGVVLVTTPQPVAVSDARKAAAMFVSAHLRVPLLGVVENMAYFSPPPHPEERYYLFGSGGGAALAQEFNVPLLGQLPLIEALRASADAGAPVAAHSPSGVAFADLAAQVAQQVALINAGARA